MSPPKTRRRLFAPDLPAQGGELALPESSVQHARVLRLEQGSEVELYDGRAGVAEASLIQVTRNAVRCRVGPRREVPVPRPALQLVLGLPKGNKLEPIARMLTELGVGALHLAVCERSVPRPGRDDARVSRLERIALEACAQSGQAHAPHFHAPAPLLEVTARAPEAAGKFVFWERARAGLASLRIEPDREEIWALVGPEGGLSDSEVAHLRGQGYGEVGLGPALLRVETAAPVIAALLLDRLGRFRGYPGM